MSEIQIPLTNPSEIKIINMKIKGKLSIINGLLIIKADEEETSPFIKYYDEESEKKYITEIELNNLINDSLINFSIIQELLIKKNEDIISKSKSIKYTKVLIDIWKSMSNEDIKSSSKYNFKTTNENGQNGYNWCKDINMSFQYKDASKTLKEIISMVKCNKYTLDISIKLKTNQIINFKVNN